MNVLKISSQQIFTAKLQETTITHTGRHSNSYVSGLVVSVDLITHMNSHQGFTYYLDHFFPHFFFYVRCVLTNALESNSQVLILYSFLKG